MKIEPSLITVEKLSNSFYVVPDYQREYVWKCDEHIAQFLEDIHQAASCDDSYFIGSMITVERPDGRYDVIDGQQRLTTIILCLCALSHILKDYEDKASYIRQIRAKVNNLLYEYNIANNTEQVRLELQYQESRNILSHIVKLSAIGGAFPNDIEATPSTINIVSAYAHIVLYYHNLVQANLTEAIEEIRYFLTKVEMVVVETKDLSSALKIFETINQRGAGLNAMDLTKNLLFINSDSSQFSDIKAIWKSISETLKKCKEDDKPMRFMRYFFMARYTSDVITEDRIYKWLTSEEGRKVVDYANSPIAFAKELLAAAKRYARLANATEKYDNGLPHIYNIGLINKKYSRQHLILLLALHPNATDEVIEYLAEKIENYFFYTVCLKIQAKYHEKFFANIAQKLRGKKTIEEIKPIIDDTLGKFIVERISDFKQIFPTLRTKIFKPDYRLRYVFGKINNHINNCCGLQTFGDITTYEQYQIEHILPQTPKDDNIGEWVSKEDYVADVLSLGNITLLEGQINKAVNKCNDISSDWFDKKQKEYLNSALPITRLLSSEFTIGNNTALNRFREDSGYSFDVWNKESIACRQKLLGKLALQIWTFDTFDHKHNAIWDNEVSQSSNATPADINLLPLEIAVDLGIDPQVEHSSKSTMGGCMTKSPRTNIRITLSDGMVIQNATAAETLVDFVLFVGIEKVRNLGLTQCKIPLISNTIDEKYGSRQKDLGDGWYLMTNTSTSAKISDIEKIATACNLDVKVEIVY